MRKQLAAVAALVGLFVTLFLGVAAGTAQATGDPEFDCVNGVGVQICDNTVDVPVDIKVVITSIRALTNAELEILEEGLDTVVDADVTKNEITAFVVNLYKNEFNITILSGNVVIIGNIPCGC